jgi:hypothetical protein
VPSAKQFVVETMVQFCSVLIITCPLKLLHVADFSARFRLKGGAQFAASVWRIEGQARVRNDGIKLLMFMAQRKPILATNGSRQPWISRGSAKDAGRGPLNLGGFIGPQE